MHWRDESKLIQEISTHVLYYRMIRSVNDHRRTSLYASPCQITVSLASVPTTLILSPRDLRIRRRIFIADISLFASLGLLSVCNSTEFVLETNINGKYREIQLALLSKRIIKLTRRDLIMFFPFWRRVIDVKVIYYHHFDILLLSLTTQDASRTAVALLKTDDIAIMEK